MRYLGAMATERAATDLSLRALCGQLLVVGFDGTTLPEDLRSSLAAGERGGVMIFKRNVPLVASGEVDLEAMASLNAAVAEAADADLPPLVSVDQEGGRVRRLGRPLLQVPAARVLGDRDDLALLEEIGAVAGSELAALGFSMSFAPVMDVATNPANPVIGDRAYADTPEAVSRAGVAYLRGLQRHVLGCAKHFPGHGDTELDSHLALPRVRHERERIFVTELPPFRAAIDAGVASLMSAHVVYDALAEGPATLSRAVMTDLLRGQLGFEGVAISDDLCMRGVSPSGGADPEEVAKVAIAAIEAGCDMLLVAHEGPSVVHAHAQLVARAESDPTFRARCLQSVERGLRMRRKVRPEALRGAALRASIGNAAAQTLQARLG